MLIAILFFVGILMGAFGSILMKVGASQIGHYEIGSIAQLIGYLYKLLTNFPAMSGMALYFLAGVVWSYLLTKLDISIVQPILALTYVITPIMAIFFLNEHVPAARWVGIATIVVGVFIVARTT